jgi:hypothetical protein
VTEYILNRDTYTLTLLLDEVTGSFECTCKPPHGTLDPDVRKACEIWCGHIGRGFAIRQRGNYNGTRLNLSDGAWHGRIIVGHAQT